MRTHLVTAIGLTFFAAIGAASGCASDVAPALGDAEEGVSEASVLAFPAQYYQVRRDCSNYVLTELGREGPKERVARLDFSPADLDERTVATALAAPPGELVVYGALTSTVDRGAVLDVQRAYRGMPDVTVSPGDRWFVVSKARDVLAPSGLVAHRIGGGGSSIPIASVSLDALEGFRIQTSWLERRVALGGAVVAGHVHGEDREGAEKVLEADQVFDLLPDRGGPCPLIFHACFDGQTPVYTRADNRCMVFAGCVGPRICPQFLTAPCDAGYTKVRWASPGPACWSEVCEPSFLTE